MERESEHRKRMSVNKKSEGKNSGQRNRGGKEAKVKVKKNPFNSGIRESGGREWKKERGSTKEDKSEGAEGKKQCRPF